MPSKQLVHNLFEQQQELTPDLIAVVDGNASITYAELDHKANILSRAILAHSAESTIIGISTTRCLEMIIGVLAILKAGKAYLPLNPTHPPAYLLKIVEDAEVDICISGNGELEFFQGLGIAALSFDSIIISSQPVHHVFDRQLTYVLYAPGANGSPQGIVMGNDACVHLINWQLEASVAGISSKTLQLAPLDVDTSFLEIFATITTGGTLCLADEKLLPEPALLLCFINDEKINRLYLPPALLQFIAEAAEKNNLFPENVSELIVTGGIVHVSAQLAAFFNALPATTHYHYFGVPGCPVIGYYKFTVEAGMVPVPSRVLEPLPYVTTHIMDNDLKAVAEGDLYVSGPGLAEGQPANNEPIINLGGTIAAPLRIFKTGFTSRSIADGAIELTKHDGSMMSLLGYRIEPMPVGQLLAQTEGVKQATAAIVDYGSCQKLVAFVSVDNNNVEDSRALRWALAAQLPRYMLPHIFEWLKELPNAPDRIREASAPARPVLETLYKVPSNSMESKVCQIIASVLSMDKVGVDDDLVDLGCDSILFVKLAWHLGQEFDTYVPCVELFNNRTATSIVAFLNAARKNGSSEGAVNDAAHYVEMQSEAMDIAPLAAVSLTDRVGVESGVESGASEASDSIVGEKIPFTATQKEFINSFISGYQKKTRHSRLLCEMPEAGEPEDTQAAIAAMDYPVVSERAKGCQVWDVDGNEYIDVLCSAPFGHQPHFVSSALQSHLEQGYTTGSQQKSGILLATAVCEMTGMDNAIICNTASDALFIALHLAKTVTGKQAVIVFKGSEAATALHGIAELLVVEFGAHDSLEKIKALAQTAAAIVVEPLGATTVSAEEAYLQQVRAITTEAGITFVASEIKSGLPGQSEGNGIVPDIFIFGNTVAAGMPIGIVACKQRWMGGEAFFNQLQPDYKNLNPLTLVAANAVLQHTRENGGVMGAQLAELTSAFATAMDRFYDERQLPFSIAHHGNSWRLKAADSVPHIGRLMFNMLLEKGIYINPHEDCYFTSAFTSEHVEILFSKLQSCIQDLTAGGFLDLTSDKAVLETVSEIKEEHDEVITVIETNEYLEQGAAMPLVIMEVPFVTETDEDAPLLYSTDVALSVVISTIAHEFGEHIAVRASGKNYTYKHINEQSNQFATLLLIGGIKPGNVVAVALDRSVEMVITLLAIMKAGGAFLLIDTETPVNRAEYILKDAGSKMLLTQKKYEGIYKTDARQILIEDAWPKLPRYTTDDVQVKVGGTDSAYLTYTLGKDGHPLGMIVEHHSLVNLLFFAQHKLDVIPGEKVLAASAIDADSFYLELLLPLVSGAEVVIADHGAVRSAKALLDIIENEQIAVALASREMWLAMLNAGWDRRLPIKALCAGEGLGSELEGRLAAKCSNLYITYGSPETTVFSAMRQVQPGVESNVIGKPIANTLLYVLGEHHEKLVAGETGAIYVSGGSVARAYVNNEGGAADRFIANPFIDNGSEKIFRTGDFGKAMTGGLLTLVRRGNRQVMLHGCHVPLDGIGAAIGRFAGITQAVAMVKDDKLICYVVPVQSFSAERVAEWKQQAQLSLPMYLQPAEYIALQELPLKENGDIDFDALQRIERQVTTANSFVAPRNETEQLVAALWAELLGTDKVSATDNFFAIGGEVQLAELMAKRLEKVTGKAITLTTISAGPTVEEIAIAIVSGAKVVSAGSIVPLKPSGSKIPLYIIHGDDISINEFTAVAKHMDQDQPVFGFQAKAPETNGEAPTMQQIAADYIQQMLKHNHGGNVALAGYSYGGYIAYEMACQLAAIGKPVKMLGMFDVYAYTKEESGPNADKQKGGLPKAMFLLNSLIKQPLETIEYQSASTKDKLAGLFSGQKRDVSTLHATYETACLNYTLQPHDGIIDLFRVQKRVYFLNDMKFLGWRPFAKKGIRVHEIPGDHKSYVEVPNNKDFAKILQNALDHIK